MEIEIGKVESEINVLAKVLAHLQAGDSEAKIEADIDVLEQVRTRLIAAAGTPVVRAKRAKPVAAKTSKAQKGNGKEATA
jgi:hypothetical protein